MPSPHKRPDPRPPLVELIELRKKAGFGQEAMAAGLGITRLHLIAIEQGRRTPSMELAARWLTILGPEAKLAMFGPLPIIEERIRAAKLLEKVSPETFRAA